MLHITSIDDLRALVGTPLPSTPWLVITQERIDLFADATDDHQWIHVDPDRAAQGSFGATIAHGFLTLSLIARFAPEIYSIDIAGAQVNYGLNRVRFPAPAYVGARLRARADIVAVDETPNGSLVTTKFTIEVDGQPRPACVAEQLTLLVD